ncbi:unnamed protein product [Caenorhabditis bovis]|uniref:Uncharacterized protein n=1 Tax=Caenorhabditis bovis TaxID=2654633 RepID=A0A8S1F9F2_9PELO|nr:unnamed protein product [Caenorhabditis bovis]
MNLYIGPFEACRRLVPYTVKAGRMIDEYVIECDFDNQYLCPLNFLQLYDKCYLMPENATNYHGIKKMCGENFKLAKLDRIDLIGIVERIFRPSAPVWMDFLTNYTGFFSENIHKSDNPQDDDEYFDWREQFGGTFGHIKPIDINDKNILFICEKPYKDSYSSIHGDVGRYSEIFFEEYALPNNQVYPTFGKYGSSSNPREKSTDDEDRICRKLMDSFSDFGHHRFIRFNEDHSLKLSISSGYFSQTKYVHTGIKESNSTRSCEEFENEKICDARRNVTASKIMITGEGNWQLTSAPFGQRSPMYCHSRYYSFDENGYCRSDFTPFVKGNYMRSIAKDGWNYYYLGVDLQSNNMFYRDSSTRPQPVFEFYRSLWDKTYLPGKPGMHIVLTKNKLLQKIE